jgi:transcriptional regulator EpsA
MKIFIRELPFVRESVPEFGSSSPSAAKLGRAEARKASRDSPVRATLPVGSVSMRIDDGQNTSAPHPRWLYKHEEPALLDATAEANPGRFSALELESLTLNLDAALRVRARHQFFSWTQGALQNLIEHEVLICALRNGAPALYHVDSFTTLAVEPAHFNELFHQDVSMVPHIIKTWEENCCQTAICEAGDGSPFSGSAFARELRQIGAERLVAHGTHDAAGQVTSFFIFACRPGAVGARQAYLVELVVPSLHLAWMRSQVNWQARSSGVKPAAAGLLTVRELEILEWIYRGKSNIEIGMILKISPLTVKNHVQKILRKLDVLNRTQAVGKALALRILNT